MLPETVVDIQTVASIDKIHALIKNDMRSVDTLLQRQLCSEVALINQVGHYIVDSGGKRLRPALTLLSAGLLSYQGNSHIVLAAIIELIHTATLLHDDVVDASSLRRGHTTANQRWGNEASVLVGDFLFSRAFQMMVEIDSMRVMDILSEATNTIAAGEAAQLSNKHNAATTEASYLAIIGNKTAKLFEAASRLGAVISQRGKEESALASYGYNLGMAFQLIDDVLDYQSSSMALGKNKGDDLAEGKPTLPLLYAMWHGNPSQTEIIFAAIESGGLEYAAEVEAAISATGAIEYTAQLARQYAEKAMAQLGELPPSCYWDALQSLAMFSVQRES